MRKIVTISVAIISVILIFLVFVNVKYSYQETVFTPTAYFGTPYFSNEANEIFVSSIAGNIDDLNSGITMERSMPMYSEQINTINFAVFNHMDEPVMFTNQGFGLTVFGYNDTNGNWESLQLQHVPYPEPKTLPPKLETWDFDINNSWDLLANDTAAWEYKQIRLYLTGTGKITNKMYGAYLDVTISASP